MATLSPRLLVRLLARPFPEFTARLMRRFATRPTRARPKAAPPGAEPVTFRFGLAGLRWGDRGPRILAVHGWEGRASQFRGLGERLAARGYQLIAIDAPAHGRSAGAEANPIVFADALVEAAAEIGPLHAVVGHSMGGAAALLAQSRGLRVARSVAIAAPAALSDVLKRMSRHVGLPARAAKRFFAQMQRHAGEPVEGIDVTALAAVHGAALVVHDRDDLVIPFADGERIARTLQAELVETHGLGHKGVLRADAVLDRIAIFLAPRLT